MQWKRYIRPAAFVVLAILTIWGLYSFLTSDSTSVVDYWMDQLYLLPVVLAIAVVDVALEMLAWMWVYARLGHRTFDWGGIRAALTSRAGLLLPAQLGRLIRPDTMARLKRGSFRGCVKAEGVTFVLDATSVGALVLGLMAAKIHWALAPVAVAVSIAAALYLGNTAVKMIAHTSLALPTKFWLSWHTVGIVLLQMLGWVVHGAGLWVMIRSLPAGVTLPDTVFYTSVASVLGAGTGLPGGIGATEGLLGVSLTLMKVPPEHLAAAIGSFRVLTFWIWIPVGWAALTSVNRTAAKLNEAAPAVSTEPA